MSENRDPVYFPLLLNLNKFPCLVVGGGKVAYRKVLSLLKFGANITVVSPRFSKPLISLAGQNRIKTVKKIYSKEYLSDKKIVFCATDNEKINKTVRRDCTELGILLNVADAPALCDFILPANVNRGNLTISISSQGHAPFFTKIMKEKLLGLIPEIYSEIIDLASEFRYQLMNDGLERTENEKSCLFKKFAAIDWESVLAGNDKIRSHKKLINTLKENNLL